MQLALRVDMVVRSRNPKSLAGAEVWIVGSEILVIGTEAVSVSGELADSNSPDELGDLRAQALLNDIERRISGQNVRLLVTRWLSLPLMLVILVAMVLGLVLGFGAPGPVLGGIVAVAGAAAGFAAWARRQDEDIGDLERERDSLLREHPFLKGQPPLIGEQDQNPSGGTS